MKDRKWCAIDSEGDVGNLGLLGCAFYSDQGGTYQTDHAEIIAALTDYAKQGYTFVAHNAEYDLSVLFWQLDIPIKAVYYNGRFNRGEWMYAPNRPRAQLWDSLRLSGGISLLALGKAMGLPKLDTPQRLKGGDPSRYKWRCNLHGTWECETCYAIRDAEIVWQFMAQLAGTLGAWGVRPKRTISGIAEKVWRALDEPEPIGIADKAANRLGRDAYHGGRTEVFRLGYCSPLYTADVQSMYPSVMLDTPFPDPGHMIYGRNQHIDDMPWGHQGVAEVEIMVPAMHVPPLPWIGSGQLLYPVGAIRGSWTLLELEYARSLGCEVRRCYQLAYSTRTIQPFDRFIHVLWELRTAYHATGDPRQLFAKLLLNNLYGRLGMKDVLEQQDIWKQAPGSTYSEGTYDGWYTEDEDLYLTYTRYVPRSPGWTNVLWAAQVTAAARVKLHKLLALQGPALVYCDTDSIFSALPILGTGSGLGELQPDGTYPAALIAGPKLYAVQGDDGKWQGKARGVPRAQALAFIRAGSVMTRQPIKPRSQSRRGIPAGTWVDRPVKAQNRPPRRFVLNPESLTVETGWSDTTAPFSGRW